MKVILFQPSLLKSEPTMATPSTLMSPAPANGVIVPSSPSLTASQPTLKLLVSTSIPKPTARPTTMRASSATILAEVKTVVKVLLL